MLTAVVNIVGLEGGPVGQRMRRAVLFAALRQEVEETVDSEKLLAASSEGRIGVEYLTVFVFVEDAVAGKVLAVFRIEFPKVIDGSVNCAFLRPERNVEIEIEIGTRRRHPLELPTHLLAYGLDLINRRSSDGDVAHIVMVEVIQETVDVLHLKRAAWALPVLVGTHHEVLDEELGVFPE